MNTACLVLLALALDAWRGEPRRWHPLVGFGQLAQRLEQRLYADSMLRGSSAVVLLLLPFTLLTLLLDAVPGTWLFEAVLLYLALGWRSLGDHARQVRDALSQHDLPRARQCVGLIVSRDTTELDEQAVVKATLESILENGNDAIFGALFWFVLAGAPGVVLYRLANTLDAMWGYRNTRYRHFGWAAARLDDVLNFIPARLTALSYALLGQCLSALGCWRRQAAHWKSPNAGPVMATGAGSVGVLLGGPAYYQGVLHNRPPLGVGRTPQWQDIDRALALIQRTLLVWVVLICIGGVTEYALRT